MWCLVLHIAYCVLHFVYSVLCTVHCVLCILYCMYNAGIQNLCILYSLIVYICIYILNIHYTLIEHVLVHVYIYIHIWHNMHMYIYAYMYVIYIYISLHCFMNSPRCCCLPSHSDSGAQDRRAYLPHDVRNLPRLRPSTALLMLNMAGPRDLSSYPTPHVE